MTTLTQGVLPNESFISEAGGTRSRDAITVAATKVVTACMVLGAAYGAATAAAKAGGNTGNGTFVMDATNPTLANAAPGVYTARFTSTTNIRIEGPDGIVLGDIAIVATTGQTAQIAEHVKALVTQGSTTFAVGDGFDITVPATRTFGPLDLTAVNGMNVAAGISYGDYNATNGAVPGVAYLRSCEHNADIVVWPAGASAGQKATATQQLAKNGIVLR